MKVTLIAQLVLGARLVPQLSLSAKFPLAVIPVIVKGDPPLFVSVTVWGKLVVPTACEAKERLEGVTLAAGGVAPVPVRVIV